MRTIEMTATVSQDRKLIVPVPEDIQPGTHRVVVVIDEEVGEQPEEGRAFDFPIHDVGPWPAHLSLGREDLYGDDGR